MRFHTMHCLGLSARLWACSPRSRFRGHELAKVASILRQCSGLLQLLQVGGDALPAGNAELPQCSRVQAISAHTCCGLTIYCYYLNLLRLDRRHGAGRPAHSTIAAVDGRTGRHSKSSTAPPPLQLWPALGRVAWPIAMLAWGG